MLDPVYIVKRPLVTEKGTYGMNEHNRFSFEVDRRASKTDIKAAIETLYKVKVEKVNTQIHRGKFRRMRYGMTQEPTTKTAVIRIKDGQTIELF